MVGQAEEQGGAPMAEQPQHSSLQSGEAGLVAGPAGPGGLGLPQSQLPAHLEDAGAQAALLGQSSGVAGAEPGGSANGAPDGSEATVPSSPSGSDQRTRDAPAPAGQQLPLPLPVPQAAQPVHQPQPPPQQSLQEQLQQQQQQLKQQPASVADVSSIPVLPDVVRQKEAKRDLPMVCHIEGCGLDLSSQAEYYQRYRICKAHLKSPALLVDGVPQRFCQQCGRFHELAEFDGEKRNCRARLEQHNSRRRKVFVTSQSTRRGRYNKDKPLQARVPLGDASGGDGDEQLDGREPMQAGERLPQYNSRGRGKQLSGSRRDRSALEEEGDVLMLTPQEKEAILLLRQAERPASQRQAVMPRNLSEPVRGLHGWRVGVEGRAGAPLGDEGLMMLHPQLQDLLGQQQFLARQEQIAAAGLQAAAAARLGGGGSAFTSVSPRPSAMLPAYNSGEQRHLAELLAGGGTNAGTPGLPGNPFAAAGGGGGAPGALDPAGGVYRTFTEPAGQRGGQGTLPRGRSGAGSQSQALAPTIPRDGLSGQRPLDAADLLRSLHAAAAPQQQQQQQQQQPPSALQMDNPFLQQRGAGATLPPLASTLSGLGSISALLGQSSGGAGNGSMPKASTLLRQMADLAASAELSMEQAALQQVAAGAGGSRPLADAFSSPFQLAEELMRRMQGTGAGQALGAGGGSGPLGQGGLSAAGGGGSGSEHFGGGAGSGGSGGGLGLQQYSAGGAAGGGSSGGGGSGGMGGLSGADLLAALTGLAPLNVQQPELELPRQQQQVPEVLGLRPLEGLWSGQQQQQQQQHPPSGLQAPGAAGGLGIDLAQELGAGAGALPPEQLIAALLSASGPQQGGTGASQPALMQDLMSLIQGTVGLPGRQQDLGQGQGRTSGAM